VHEDFIMIGRDLAASGAVTSHGGNMSRREGDALIITRTGSMLGHLTEDDIMETSLVACGDPRDGRCSVELVVHRAIYQATDALAVVHAHTAHTIVRSLVADTIAPMDSESQLRLGEVPVVSHPETIGSAEAGALIASALREHPVVVLRGHGPFAAGATLEDAYQYVSCLEASCRILDWLDATGRDVIPYR
jgi:L-fuculose-phosphate aldolase